MNGSSLNAAFIVFRKEIVDALRDRRTLMVVLVSSVMLGPLVLIALSAFIAGFEARAEKREVVVAGIEHAPSLRNYFERQTYTVIDAPTDFEAKLRASKLGDPVVVIPDDFESAVLHGDAPVVEVVSDSANKQAESGTSRIQRLLAGFSRERATLNLAMRGVSAEAVEPIRVEERDLASTQTRATQITGMLPFFVIMAVLYGALNAALDTTAGERERGSLEPLLMNPAGRVALVLGKWGAVACLGMLIAVLSCFSFLPAQWLLRSDTLQAMFQFGLREALLFLAVLLPFAAALSALLMAVAIRCKTFKEAQASSAVVILGISLLPMVALFNQSGESAWQLWVPALAQFTLMTRVLRGEGFGAEQVLVPLLVCVVLTAAGVWFVARMLRHAAVR
jgi:sodium transport system permease protein